MPFGQEFTERKTVTVLFADLVGSTSVGERLDVEAHQALMSGYFDAMRLEAQAVGGIVEQFVGDAVLVVFGLPVAHEDDPDRALDAADRMLRRLDELNRGEFARHGISLDVRIGVNMGEVVVRSAGVALGALTGDALNVAARLAGHADPGGVLVSGAAARMSRNWRFRPAGSVDLRGRSAPVPTFEVIGAADSDRQQAAPSRAPITGRHYELTSLSSILTRVESDRRPQLVTMIGPAGIGKSRLTAEFAARAERAGSPARVLFGRCRPYGEGVALGALAEILTTAAGIDDEDAAAEAAAKVWGLVDELSTTDTPAPDSAAEVLAYAAGLSEPGSFASLPAPQIRAVIGEAWIWLLGRMAASETLVIIIEDMHWADPAFLDVLEGFTDRVAGPVLFMCPARPALLERRPSWGSGRSNVTILTLNPLTTDEAMGMIDWYLGNEPARSLGSQIVDRADGNPYFIEEIIRGLIDQGSVVRDGNTWRVTGPVESLEIPQTVQAVISARIDLLDPVEKRVLQAAAVIGRTFWIGAAAHLLGADRDEVTRILDRLEERELALPGTDSVLSSEREYRFKHALVREVAYNTLARRDRSDLHTSVSEWLGEGVGEGRAMVALQAHHLSVAYDGLRSGVGGTEETEELRIRALEALLAASESARVRVSLGQARYFARQAKRLAETSLEASRAAEALGEAFFYAYQGDGAWESLRAAVDLRADVAEGIDPEIGRLCARALQLLVRWSGAMQTRPDELTVLRYLHLGMDHTPPGSEDAVRLLTLQGIWQHAFPRPDDDPRSHLISPEESLRSGEQAVAAARELERPDLESAALDAVAGYYIPRGLYSTARRHTRRRLELLGFIDDLWEIGDTYSMQGWVGFHLGEYAEAEHWTDTGYARTVSEAPSLALQCLRWRALSRFRLGDWDGVRRDLAIARNLLGEERDDPPDFLSPAFSVAALVHAYRGEQMAADAVLDVLRALYERRSFEDRDSLPLSQWAEWVAPIMVRRGEKAEARRLLAQSRWRRRARLGLILESSLEVAAEAGDWDEAPGLIDQARAIAAEGGLLALGPAADALEGLALRASGELAAAIALLDQAAQGYGRLGAVWDTARIRLELAETYEQAGFFDRVAAVLAECKPVLERLGARREIDRARDLEAALS